VLLSALLPGARGDGRVLISARVLREPITEVEIPPGGRHGQEIRDPG